MADLFVVLYKWEDVAKEDYEDEDDLNEWKLETEANADSACPHFLYPRAIVREMSAADCKRWGVVGKPFFAKLFQVDDDDSFEDQYFETKSEAFEWCEEMLGLTKVGSK